MAIEHTFDHGGCVFPGCGRTLWVDAHHIIHWADHGPTDLTNLVLLCRHHHRAIHEGGYTITGDPQHRPVTFHRPDGGPVDPRCEHITTTIAEVEDQLPPSATDIGPGTITGHYAGDPLDLGYAVGCLIDSERGPGHRDDQIAGGGHTFASRVAETTHDSSFLPHQQNHMQY